MNKKRRAMIASAKAMLQSAASIIERAADEETDCMDNLPESLQDSERYEKMEIASTNLDEALGHINDAIDKIDEAIA